MIRRCRRTITSGCWTRARLRFHSSEPVAPNAKLSILAAATSSAASSRSSHLTKAGWRCRRCRCRVIGRSTSRCSRRKITFATERWSPVTGCWRRLRAFKAKPKPLGWRWVALNFHSFHLPQFVKCSNRFSAAFELAWQARGHRREEL